MQDLSGGDSRAFVMAAASGDLPQLIFLRAAAATGISPSLLNAALVSAALHGQEKTCRQLLVWGADARHNRSQALLAAVKANHGYVTDLLLRAGARMEDAKQHRPHMSLLAQAIEEGHADAAKALLLHGANPNVMHPFSGTTLQARAHALGLIDTYHLMERLWAQPPRVPDDFAQRLPLDQLRDAFPTHAGFTGFQLAAYHGQMEALLARLTAQGRTLAKSDLITATPRYPQTLLFILGQRGELAKVFDLGLWAHDVTALRDLLRYVPAAFRGQLDDAGIPTRLRQEKLRQQRKNNLRLK